MKTNQPSRVSHGKPHPTKRGWTLTLDCGHTVFDRMGSGVGALYSCHACKREAKSPLGKAVEDARGVPPTEPIRFESR